MQRPRVLLADDHRIFVAGLEKLLNSDFDIVGTVNEGQSLVKDVERLRPALAVVDVSMPGMDGIKALRMIRERAPDTKIVILSMHSDASTIEEAMSAGASAYVVKRDAPEVLIKAMRAALRGQHTSPPEYRSPSRHFVVHTLASEKKRSISLRQKQILHMICQGHAAKQIAAELHISQKTVEFHKYKMMRDVGAHSTAQLITIALRNGWVDP